MYRELGGSTIWDKLDEVDPDWIKLRVSKEDLHPNDKGHEYSSGRYKGEYERSLAVLDIRLEGKAYILGGEYSIADMISFPWAFIAKAMGVSLEDFPNVAAWRGRIKKRKAVQRAINLYKDKQNH